MSDDEQNAHSIALMMKINIITGWPLPQLPEQENILAEQLKLYLVENFSLLNVEEIMYAIRSYGTHIENWGKNMNLSLIAKALTSYDNERKELSKLEESQRKPQTEKLIAPHVDWSELGEMYYQDLLQKKFNISIMPAEIYEAAMKAGYMSSDAYEDWLSSAKEVLSAKFHAELNESVNEKDRHEIKEKIIKLDTGELNSKVIEMAEKMAVEYLFKMARHQKRKRLF